MHGYTSAAPYSDSLEPPLSSPTAPNSPGSPERAGRRAGEASLSETAFSSHTVYSSRAFEAITIKDHVLPLDFAHAHAQAPTTFLAETRSSSIASRTRSLSSPGLFALAGPLTQSATESEMSSSPRLTEITAVPVTTTAAVGTGITVQPSLSSHTTERAPAQTSPASLVKIGSARTTGIIIGSVLGGTAVLVFAMLAIIYLAWRRRRKRRDHAERGGNATQQQRNEATGGAGDDSNDIEGQKGPRESPTILPLQGTTIPRPMTLGSEPIINDISPITPIMPHLSLWTSEKAYIPSPAGRHPATIDAEPNLRHHPLFASTHYDNDDHANAVHASHNASPCLSSSPEPSPPSPAATAAAAEAEAQAQAQALASFLFFDSPSSRSSRRPSTRDSSAPCTALGVPPPLHRGPPPRRRHTRAGGQSGSARCRSGSRSPVGGDSGAGAGGAADFGVANSTGQHTAPPPVPARNGARSKSLRGAERPAAWI